MENSQRPIIQSCFINGEVCRNGKRDDFKVDPQTGEKFLCNKWVKLSALDPQTKQPIDTWCCNEFAGLKLELELANLIRINAAGTDKIANTIFGLASPEARERLRQADVKPQITNGQTEG